ncbi:hypothetical protein ACFPN2_34370 [Steroidobacter flavus]|uniref:Uncharacterized protein n=1 Tax=Steroidobacter flavus TaxID=1842136 RepID=A0ABV8T4P0_9GAMM
MPNPQLYVDFNEMLEPDLVLLSAEDTKRDVAGALVQLREAMAIDVYMDDVNERGEPDNLVASGRVEKNQSTGWGSNARWCCRIDEHGIRHQSDLGKQD